ncbi:MAG TPA: hypothetical protein VGP80_09200 [Gemmatimonadales bacterium]|nr:hypothetical protein [Gemmatimonadales bacterium]
MLLPEAVARADGSAGFIVIVIIYAVLTVVGKIKQAAQHSQQPPRPTARPPARQVAKPRPTAAPARRPAPPVSAEAQRLEELLRGLAQSRAEATENTESLEVDRDEVDQDSEAEAIAQRRIQAAMARNRPLTDQDHAEFDSRLKRDEAKQPVVRNTIGRNRLRNAFIWREILGPPGGLRTED